MGQTPEGRVKRMVKKALEQFGDECWRFMPVQGGYGAVALDFLMSIRGRFVAIETKAPGNKPTALQEQTMAQIRTAGGLVFVVDDQASCDYAMAQIQLALKFENINNDATRIACIRTVYSDGVRRGEQLVAVGLESPKAWPEKCFHEAEQPAPAADDAAGRDHGASQGAPERRAKPRTRRQNQRVTAAVNDGDEDGNC